ncbi:MAG: 4-hydroxy-3-methylbut-2-enyl diphosphate reductase, partial [Caldimicrobium sp.]
MQIRIAKKAGFCMGVRRAVNLVLKALKEEKSPLYTYGPLIHNPQTLELLSQLGVKILKSIEDNAPYGVCILRAHGVPPKEKMALEKKFKVIDGTCPRVLKVQALAKKAISEGKEVIIIGDKEHSEVKGILGYCEGKGYVVSSFQDIENLPHLKNYLILSQTTQEEEIFEMLSQEILNKYPGGEVINTICNATEVRQREVKRLCEECEAIIVIGGKFSANTNRLAQIAKAEGKKVYLVERADELPLEEIEKFSSVGITAGASTPNWLINEVVDKIKEKISPFYRLLKSLTFLSIPECLAFFLFFLSLLLLTPFSLTPKDSFLLPFVIFFQLFQKNLLNLLNKEDLKFYYPLKGNFLNHHLKSIYLLLGFSILISLLSGMLYLPRILTLIVVFLFLNLLLAKTLFARILDLLYMTSLILYLYPFWNEIFLWNALFVLGNLVFLTIYLELIYLQSDGFLPKNFLIFALRIEEKKWYTLLRFFAIILFFPFIWLAIKYKSGSFFIFILLLPLYML